MNFFKSVFSDEPTPPDSPKSESNTPTHNTDPTNSATWSFGGLIKTLATKSESMIETYRKDFGELGSGLRKETAVIRDVASRAVKDLPASFDVGASVAQESLETVGQAFDDISSTVWKSTAQIISHGKHSILAPKEHNNHEGTNTNKESLNLKRYSRFDMQVNAIQCDVNTYCNEPEDTAEYEDWRLGFFNLEEKKLEIDSLIGENKVIKEYYDELVLIGRVDNVSFWSRYFYKMHKLKKAEEARALLVKRAISDEEDLSWDFEDDEEEDVNNNNNAVSESSSDVSNKSSKENENESDVNKLDKCEEKKVEQMKGGNGESCKDSDSSVVSSRQSLLPEEEEEDLGWDEIEEIDESKGESAMGSAARTSTSRLDLHKRLSAAEVEDLSWDIDDEPSKP